MATQYSSDGGLATSPQKMRLSAADRPYRGVHVVTVLHNSSETLDAYFRGLVTSAGRIEGVTIVDNGSADDSLDRAEAFARTSPVPFEVVQNSNDGFAGGYRAAGSSAVSRSIPVLCLNPDVELSDHAIDHLLEGLNAVPEAAIVTLPLVESDGRPDSASRRRLPKLGGSIVYSLLGRFTPKRIRYNNLGVADGLEIGRTTSNLAVTSLEATTGALMLVDPSFRTLDDGIFDADYWMYGEDLQLCKDAHIAGRRVAMVESAPSVHVKGVSSGRPRSTFANKAFHDAMYVYARKNLLRTGMARAIFRSAVVAHFLISEVLAVPERRRLARLRVRP